MRHLKKSYCELEINKEKLAAAIEYNPKECLIVKRKKPNLNYS